MSLSPLDALLTRRSVLARHLTEPGPSPEQLQRLLEAAHRVPDHGKIGPWRFVIFREQARGEFGEQLAQITAEDSPQISEKLLNVERTRLTRAPLVIAVISAPIEHKVPQWEQVLSSGAVCQNLLHSAQALNYGAQWLTEWYAYHPKVRKLLGLSAEEKIAGFIYIGTVEQPPTERTRPALEERISYWGRD